MNIIMMGAQGTGKGTVAGLIKDELNIPHISTGEIFRKNIKEGTELGKIAQAISSQKAEITPLQKKMNELSKILSILVVVIAVIMFVVGYLEGNPILDVFMLAISLAVAAIPEGLSAVITITLAIGVQKMAKEKAIIRKLSSVY